MVLLELNVSWILSGFLSMILYEVSHACCLRYIICSAWFLDIRTSTCSYYCNTKHNHYYNNVHVYPFRFIAGLNDGYTHT